MGQTGGLCKSSSWHLNDTGRIFRLDNHRHLLLVAWYLACGIRVSIFDFTFQLRLMAWLRRLIHEGWFENIYFYGGLYVEGLGTNAAEWFYPRVSSQALIRRLGHSLERPGRRRYLNTLSLKAFRDIATLRCFSNGIPRLELGRQG